MEKNILLGPTCQLAARFHFDLAAHASYLFAPQRRAHGAPPPRPALLRRWRGRGRRTASLPGHRALRSGRLHGRLRGDGERQDSAAEPDHHRRRAAVLALGRPVPLLPRVPAPAPGPPRGQDGPPIAAPDLRAQRHRVRSRAGRQLRRRRWAAVVLRRRRGRVVTVVVGIPLGLRRAAGPPRLRDAAAAAARGRRAGGGGVVRRGVRPVVRRRRLRAPARAGERRGRRRRAQARPPRVRPPPRRPRRARRLGTYARTSLFARGTTNERLDARDAAVRCGAAGAGGVCVRACRSCTRPA